MRNLKAEIKAETCKHGLPFWGLTIAVFSLCIGVYSLVYRGYLYNAFNQLFEIIPEWSIAALLIICSLIKLYGIFSQDKRVMRVGIVSLASLWTGLFAVFTVYSFGTGYPSPSYLFYGLVMVACYRISWKGDFV